MILNMIGFKLAFSKVIQKRYDMFMNYAERTKKLKLKDNRLLITIHNEPHIEVDTVQDKTGIVGN